MTTTWAYSGSAIVAELAGTGAGATLVQTFTLIPGTGDPIAASSAAGESAYPLTDRLGSVIAVTDAAGDVVGRTRYSAFGASQTTPSRSGLPSVYGYTGHSGEEGGLVYARARWYYDPSIGRFISEDPAQGANLYAYVDNDPLNYTDPSGAMAAVEYGLIEGEEDSGIYAPATMLGTTGARGFAQTVSRVVNNVLQADFRALLPRMLSPAERAAYEAAQEARNSPLMSKLIGQAVHRATAEALEDMGSSANYKPWVLASSSLQRAPSTLWS